MYQTRILLDSLAPCGKRLTTFEATYARFIHSELMTHRVFSRNSASSRTIPTTKLLASVANDPALPLWWGKNEPGMQARAEVEGEARERAKALWLEGRDQALRLAEALAATGLHKQIANRVLEPWAFITVLITATEYENFFALRCHPDAQPEIRWVADDMRRQYLASEPTPLAAGAWHMPLLKAEDLADASLSPEDLRRVSVGRCARVSYLTHSGLRAPLEDVALCGKLIASGHMSPTEHVAQALDRAEWRGNVCGWRQYRQGIEGEAVFGSGRNL